MAANTHQTKFTTPFCFGLLISAILISGNTLAFEEKLIENPAHKPLKNTWVVNYEGDDFSEKLDTAKVLFIPADFSQEAAFFLRCNPFFTNFSIQYTEQQKNLMEDGELPNASSKYAKHGYIYDSKQTLKVKSESSSESYRLSIGGQTNHLSKLFKTELKQSEGLLGMSGFFSFTFEEMPSFRQATTNDEARDFFEQLNEAIANQENLDITLISDNGHKRQFNLDTQRMLKAVPQNVMEFCLTKRKIK
ncbi:hypothetical protein [Thiomicrorhabdus sediminis]|uniref:Uncharacterized protein n=1 Tax=Thiomicrorhabdus sediminis TaxID=2580412 RepID=A0A4P9K4T1_9GAMM|nr:hypothetical protein [Thiomicrorhabdus sediminis]QCU89959.1 hypothetical protein FE785_04585 [Thiomicrorhabdus sediminis]